jgi:hydrogenase maturation protease
LTLGGNAALSFNGDAVNLWIIGYGNNHRRDDGAGRFVAEQLMPLYGAVAGVHILSLHQLGPELAEDIHTASGIVFVDAVQGELPGYRCWSRIRPVEDMASISHSLTAAALLGLTQILYSRRPPARMVSIRGCDFDFGEGLSQTAAFNAMQTITKISRFINRRLISTV